MQKRGLNTLVELLSSRENDYVLLRSLLRELRDTATRRPDLVLKYAPNLLKYATSLGNEAWTVQEQLFMAALDLEKMDVAESVLAALDKNFPYSIRVERLRAMMMEAAGDFAEAEAIYNKILTEEPTDRFSMRRRICVWKSQKETKDRAIEELNDYLKIYMADKDAWQELAELYLEQQLYSFAAFCYEELIVAEPVNHHYHTRYAEILYTMKDFTGARKYFAHAIELNSSSVRALYGLSLCVNALIAKRVKAKDNAELFDLAATSLKSIYSKKSPQLLETMVIPTLDKLQP